MSAFEDKSKLALVQIGQALADAKLEILPYYPYDLKNDPVNFHITGTGTNLSLHNTAIQVAVSLELNYVCVFCDSQTLLLSNIAMAMTERGWKIDSSGSTEHSALFRVEVSPNNLAAAFFKVTEEWLKVTNTIISGIYGVSNKLRPI